MSTEIASEGHASRLTQVNYEEPTQPPSFVSKAHGLVERNESADGDEDENANDIEEGVDQDVPLYSAFKDNDVDVFDESDLEDRLDEKPPLTTTTTPSIPPTHARRKRQSCQTGGERRASSRNLSRLDPQASD
ncbi:unnamed protein product [Linum trigynum]|uniref:Uncharacterized protein n=1 Tax=Linum trigynum TaxID=586398 RepID=A0AAV2DUQ2_9ROSI